MPRRHEAGKLRSAKKGPRKGRVPGGQRTPSVSGSDWTLVELSRGIRCLLGPRSLRSVSLELPAVLPQPQSTPRRCIRSLRMHPCRQQRFVGPQETASSFPVQAHPPCGEHSCFVPRRRANRLDPSRMSWRENMAIAETGQGRFFARFPGEFRIAGWNPAVSRTNQCALRENEESEWFGRVALASAVCQCRARVVAAAALSAATCVSSAGRREVRRQLALHWPTALASRTTGNCMAQDLVQHAPMWRRVALAATYCQCPGAWVAAAAFSAATCVSSAGRRRSCSRMTFDNSTASQHIPIYCWRPSSSPQVGSAGRYPQSAARDTMSRRSFKLSFWYSSLTSRS